MFRPRSLVEAVALVGLTVVCCLFLMIADPSLSAGLDRVEETLVLVALFVTEQCDLVFVASTFVIMHEISFLWYTSDLFVAEFDFLLMSLLL